MANYTSDEIQTAVEQIVRSSVRTPTGSVGERRVDTTFTDLQEAASGVYVLYYNAPFYTVGLGTTRLADAVQTQQNILSSVIDAIRALGNIVTPVEDISALANAKAALLELEGAVSARAEGFADIEQVPAFRRYARNMSQWVSEYGSNVKGMVEDDETGADVPGIVDTPSGAKFRIPGLVKQLVEQHKELIRRATLLAGAMDDFARLRLPQVTAQGVISRARQVLGSLYDTLSGQTPEERLGDLRSVLLDLLTQQPLVQQYGAALGPSEYLSTRGRGSAYSDGTHVSLPAQLAATEYGPYPITAANQFVRFTMDGGTPFEFPMPLGYVAELRATFAGPYRIDATNDSLVIDFGLAGLMARYYVTLTHGTFYAEGIVSQVNAVLVAIPLRCETFFTPTKYDSYVLVAAESFHVARFTVMAGGLSGLNILPDDEVDILDGPNAGTTWHVSYVDPAGQYVLAGGYQDVTPVGLPDGVHIQIGPSDRALRLIDTDAELSQLGQRSISLPVMGSVSDLGAATLGFYPGMQVRSRPVAAVDVANYIASSTSLLNASTEFGATFYIGNARAYETDHARIVLSEYYGAGSITAGTVTTFTPGAPFPTAVLIGYKVVIRASITPDDVGRIGTITQLTPVVQVVFSTPVAAGSITVDIGPSVMFGSGDILNITLGPNQGRYVVREPMGYQVDSPLEVLLEAALPVPVTAGTFSTFSVELGAERVVFASRVAQLNSQVVVDNPVSAGQGAEYFFAPTEVPASAVGTTPWLRFEQFPSGAQIGDIVQLYETNFLTPSRQFTIVATEQGARVLKVTPGLAPVDDFSFALNALVPFGRIRVAKVADFQAFEDRLLDWLALPEQQLGYFTGILPVLNPLLTTTNPTAAQIGTAVNYFMAMAKVLTIRAATNHVAMVEDTLEYALQQYSPPPEEAVDTLLTTFRNKGADRAIDLLLEGQFGTFFGLSMDETSYSGALLRGIQDMAREDLPVRKFDRRKLIGQSLIGTSPNQKDSEFNAEDADSPNQPDIPIGDSLVRPGTSWRQR